MNDLLTITDLEIWTHIGVPKEERASEQRLLVTVEMHLDTKAAAKSDDVKKSINYFDVSEDLKKLAQMEHKTVERFAEDIAQLVLSKYKSLATTVTVKKFAIAGSRHISLIITRTSSSPS